MTAPLPGASRALAGLALAAGLWFAAAVALGLHGYSIPAWHTVIDGSEPVEVLRGEPRMIRSDDWNVILALALAQTRHEPSFPLLNRAIGNGFNVSVPFPVPVAHPLVAFRPTVWGFFLGPDAGMAWMWWSRLLGVAGVWLLVFLVVSGNRLGLSLLASAALAASPFLQLWSLRPTRNLIYGGLAFLALLGITWARRRVSIAGCGLLLGWAGGCMALTLYPPFQVPIATLLALLFATLAWQHRDALELRRHAGWRAGALVGGAAIALGAVALLLAAGGEAIEAMQSTAFPGRRIATGGDRSLWELLGSNLLLPLRIEDWGPLDNVCEAASWWLLSPVVLAAALVRRARGGPGLDAVEAGLALLGAALAVHATLGIPEWLARASGWSLVPGRRSTLALGVVDLLLLLRLLARTPRERVAPLAPTLAIAALWGALLGIAAWQLAAVLPDLELAWGLALAAANAALAALALRARRAWLPLAVLLAATLATTAWFNPVVRGGSAFVLDNPLSQRIRAIDREHGGQTTWLAFGRPELANLIWMQGVRSLNGLHAVPQLDFWHALDPARRHQRIYNRYAHVSFVASARRDFRVRAYSRDFLIARVHPADARLRQLGVTHMLVQHEDVGVFARLSGHEHLASFGDLHLFAARWDAER